MLERVESSSVVAVADTDQAAVMPYYVNRSTSNTKIDYDFSDTNVLNATSFKLARSVDFLIFD